MHILLSGPPFVGKTTTSKELAKLLGWTFTDTDTLLEEKFHLPCAEQFKKFGNQGFRENEQLLLQELANSSEKMVISLGGGTLTYPPNAEIVKLLGFVVVLHCPFHVLYGRLLESGRIPAYLDADNLEESFRNLIAAREAHYRHYADLLVDVNAKSPQEVAGMIIAEYNKTKKSRNK